MGFAVLPARPYKARDEAAGESSIGVVQRGFFQEIRNRVFYSLQELNLALREYLERLNRGVMKDYGVSRAQRFEEEKRHLKPLPSSPFEMSEWRAAKVHPDCHVQVEKNFYSVPFVYVGQKLRVRLTDKMMEVFTENSLPLTAHLRLHGIPRGFSKRLEKWSSAPPSPRAPSVADRILDIVVALKLPIVNRQRL